MAKILVAGHINVETTVKMDGFPIDYQPVRYVFGGVRSSVSGVGYNIAKPLTTLGHEVDLLSIVGQDLAAQNIRSELQSIGIATKHVLSLMSETAQSAILYDADGKRMITTDLKTIQETNYPLENLNFEDVDLAVLTNINFSRPMLAHANAADIPIACDVQTISSTDDNYNRDYMQAADILFMSNEKLPTSPDEWIKHLWDEFQTPIIGIGLGAEGALIAIRETQTVERIPAKALRPIVNTVGSGDSLFSSFIHSYLTTNDPIIAMQKAVLFAGYKIGVAGGGEGFMIAEELENAYRKHYA